MACGSVTVIPIKPFTDTKTKKARQRCFSAGGNQARRAQQPSFWAIGRDPRGNPFGLVPHGLIGLGPPMHKVQTDTTSQHAIFLFSDETVTRVLKSYAVYLQETFTEQELTNGLFTAVGAVHRGDAEVRPRFVRHYWDQYDHELTASEPKPSTFFQYVAAGRKATAELSEAHQAVEKIAEGILRLVRIGARSARPSVRPASTDRSSQSLTEMLSCEAGICARCCTYR